MSEDKSKLQLIGEIAQANNKNLELIVEINEKEEEIERLNKELKSLQDSYDIEEEQANYHIDLTDDLREEVDRLNNIINELVKFMDEDYEYYEKYGYAEQGHAMGQIRRIKNKLQELKGSDKE